jgi:hypothetical protein
MTSRRRKIALAEASSSSDHAPACSAALATYGHNATSGASPVSSGRGGTYSIKFGTILLRNTPAPWMAGPNNRSGRRANVSAERPTTNSPKVSTAVRKGDENDENSVAIPATIATSHIVSVPRPSSTRRSSGAAEASSPPYTATKAAHAMGK